MNLILHLPPETEQRLDEQARALAKAPEVLALEALNDKPSEARTEERAVSVDEWFRELDAWVSGHESRNPWVDDSRESIYPDR
jgi:predicted transcriptional regulator